MADEEAMSESLGLPLEEQRRLMAQLRIPPPVIPQAGGIPMPNLPHPAALAPPQQQTDAIPPQIAMPQRGMPNLPSAPVAPPSVNPHTAELARLTIPGADPNNPLANKPGVSQIHNPILRTLGRIGDVAGTIIAPRVMAAIPGTTLHHNMLVGEQEGLLNQDVKREQEQAQTAAQQAEVPVRQAEVPLREAETEEAKARAEALRHPKPEKGEALQQEYADAVTEEVNAGRDPSQSPKVQQLADAITSLQKQPAPPKENDFEQFYKDFLKDNNFPDTAHNRLMARKEYAAAGQLPQRPPQVTVVVPTPGGGQKLETLRPGQELPPGAMSPTQAGAVNEGTSTTRTMVESAPKVLGFIDRIEPLIDKQVASLGPAAGRWNEFMTGKVGAPNPEFAKLRTDYGLLQTLLMRMHVGARGGEYIMKHFSDLLSYAGQSPENMKAALEEVRAYANDLNSRGQKQAPAETPKAAPETHIFDSAAWKAKNPNGDVEKAKAKAAAQGYEVR